jgi:hypothetical protein
MRTAQPAERNETADAALERMRNLPPPDSGVIGDEEYLRPPPLVRSYRHMPPPPANMDDREAVRKWLDHCTALRTMFGSGN